MAYHEFRKNNSNTIRITPRIYQGHDLIDVRMFTKKRGGEIFRTYSGISLNVDQIPDLIEGLVWALQQPCLEDEGADAVPTLNSKDAGYLAEQAHVTLLKHGMAVHWDVAESMVLDKPETCRFTKWELHFVLATRNDLFAKEESGCFRAIKM